MAAIQAYKMNGLGNNFIIIDRRKNYFGISKEMIVKLEKKKLFQFDQLITLDKEENNISPIKIFNPDGIEVGACGNGVRCIAYLISKEKNKKIVFIKAEERVLKAEIFENQIVKINMGLPKFKWKDIPLQNEKLDPKKILIDFLEKDFGTGFCVNVGNPHIIFFVKDCQKINIKSIGTKIENHDFFPERINVTFAQILDRENIKVNVWERGAGQTKACGTAACATGVVASLKKLTERKSSIHFKEGIIKIDYDESSGEIYKTGPVSSITEVNLDI